ncbi:hypothetical protein GGP41_003260 [Bipolaris sorokiniana]|uniref:Uncharacterized protein n=1 Tax=Cochliobolus sativus TaxID=45130 RepID=A0A8H6DT07_COCSA|nr:hypothetical protein GGP41_003260 [Bipolaris sorokiniana]
MSMSELPQQIILQVKASALVFYNDEMDDVEVTKPPPKPRPRPTTETDDQYQARGAGWEAQKARNPIISRPGNCMTAEYYTKNILPIYRDAYHSLVSRSDILRAHLHPDCQYNCLSGETSPKTTSSDGSKRCQRDYNTAISVQNRASKPNFGSSTLNNEP